MLMKILGALSILAGAFFLIGGPSNRAQIAAYDKTAILLGIVLIAIGFLMLKW